MEKIRVVGWWEEYRCGCVSRTVPHKKDLPGYCPRHGENSRGARRDTRVADRSSVKDVHDE